MRNVELSEETVEAEIPIIRQKWKAIQTDCRLGDDDLAVRALRNAYLALDENPPSKIQLVDSPGQIDGAGHLRDVEKGIASLILDRAAADREKKGYWGKFAPRFTSLGKLDSTLQLSLNLYLGPLHNYFETPQLHSYRLAVYDAYLLLGLGLPDGIRVLTILAQNSFGFVTTKNNGATICRKPESIQLITNSRGEQQLSCSTGPAIRWRNGEEMFALQGLVFPKKAIMSPQHLTWKEILGQRDIETRRLMIDRLGLENLLAKTKAKKLGEDEQGTLWRITQEKDEPLVVLEVANKTQEMDGRVKHYFLRVPPNVSTAREAVAWSFEMEPEEYRPSIET